MVTTHPARVRIKAEQRAFTPLNLAHENQRLADTGATSSGNRHRGFLPAFLETRTGEVFLSRFADGRLAPVHVLDGLPPALVTRRTPAGQVTAACGSVISGFVRAGEFYTRDETAQLIKR